VSSTVFLVLTANGQVPSPSFSSIPVLNEALLPFKMRY
jgi:hypothetical protein